MLSGSVFTIFVSMICFVVRIPASQKATVHCKISSDDNYKGVDVRCPNKGLTKVPGDLPSNTTSLDLSYNSITIIKDDDIANLHRLRTLDLSFNHISRLDSGAFTMCSQMMHLNLSQNHLAKNNQSFPGSVFDGLKNLRSLNLTSNKGYPDRIFKKLGLLQSLQIDSPTEPYFGEGFQHLVSLTSLILVSNSNILRNTTFIPFHNISLQRLQFQFSTIDILESGTFAPLRDLKELELANTNFGLHTALKSLSSFSNRHMTLIKLINVFGRFGAYRTIMDTILENDIISTLADICVDKLILSNNRIKFINTTAIKSTKISECLRYLDVSKNELESGYIHALFFLRFPNLEYVDISLQAKGLTSPVHPFSLSFPRPVETAIGYQSSLSVTVPRNLTYVNICGCTQHFSTLDSVLTVKNGQSVHTFNLSFVGLQSWLAPIYGLIGIKTLDVSGNPSLRLSVVSFEAFQSLENLYLNYYSFQQEAVSNQAVQILMSLPNLQSLRLRNNRLASLPNGVFAANSKLLYLDLSGNIFNSVPFDILSTPHLSILDLRTNLITKVDATTQRGVDGNLRPSGTSLTLSLQGNILSCGCESFSFLVWLTKTRMKLSRRKNLSCLLSNGEIINIDAMLENTDALWRQCTGQSVLYGSLTLLIALTASSFVVLLLKTNKTVVANALMNLLRKQVYKPKRRDYKYDVYVSYAERDYLWVCHCLGLMLEESDFRVFIWDRDSVPGNSIPDQIAESIEGSWKVIIYLTECFLLDAWGYVNITSALSKLSNLNPKGVVLLLPERQKPRIPQPLLNAIPESCVLCVPDDVMENLAFWDDLIQILNNP